MAIKKESENNDYSNGWLLAFLIFTSVPAICYVAMVADCNVPVAVKIVAGIVFISIYCYLLIGRALYER